MWTNEYDPEQPRDAAGKWTDGGSPVGDAFATKGGKFPNVKQSAKWAMQYKERYDTDPAFKGTVQAALLFAGGGFSDLRAIDNINRGLAQPPEMQMHVGLTNLEQYATGDVSIGRLAHPLAEYHNPFEPDNPDDSIHHSTVSARDAVSNLRKAVENGEVFDVSLYRGLVFERLPEWDMRQLEQSRAYVKEHTLENGYRQDEIDRLQRNQADADRWEAVYKERATFINSLSTLKAGDAFDIDSLSSFTVKEGVADSFARGTNAGQGQGRGRERAPALSVLIEVAPGATGLNVSRLSKWAQSEVIVSGKFKVTSVDDKKETSYSGRRGYGYKQESRVVRIRVEPANALKANSARWKRDWGRLLMGLDDNSQPFQEERVKFNNALPALGYRLASVRAAGWKINEQDKDGNEGRWVTMSGTPVFIKDGEDPKEAAARTFKDKPLSKSQSIQAQKKEGFFKRAWREAKEDISNYLNPKVPDMPNKPEPPARTGASTKLQRIRDVGLGAKETVAELFFKKHVDDLYNGKMSTADKVDDLMKKGVIKTGAEKPETVRERAIKDFDKAVALREQQTADRMSGGEGKRAYTDKTLRAGLGKGETLAERYFAGHVDDLYDGNTSVTAKVDSLIKSGELGFGRGDKGFVKMRETAIKDFTRALNLRESHDVKLEKQKLEDAKPKKLTKREQQAEWTPSEEEIAATGPVVGTYRRNMAENQPRDEQGRWTDGNGGVHASPEPEEHVWTKEEIDASWAKHAELTFQAIPEYARASVKALQVFQESQSYDIQAAGESLGKAAGDWNSTTRVIRLFGSAGISRSVIAHEVGHSLHDDWQRDASYEFSTITQNRPDLIGRNGYPLPGKEVEAARLAPMWDLRERFTDAWLAGGDGVTAYSRAWGLKGQICETTAELFSIYHTAGGGKDGRVAVLENAKQQATIMFPADSRWGGLSRGERETQSTKLARAFLDMVAVKEGRPPARYKPLKTNSTDAEQVETLFFDTAGNACAVRADWAYGQQLTFDAAGRLTRSVRFVPHSPKTNAFDPTQPRDEAGKWALSGSKLVGALTSLYGAQPTPPADGKGWLRPDGLFVDGGNTSHVAMLRAAYGERKGKAPAFAEDMYRMAFHAGLVRYDRHAGVIEISGTPTEDQKTALRKMFDGLETHESIEVEVFRTPETRYYSEQDRASHRRWMETSPDSMMEKVDAFYGSKGDGYVSPLAQFRGNAFDPNQPRDPDGKWTGGTLNFSNEPERVGGFTKDVAVRRSTVMKGEERVTTWHNPDGSQIADPKLVARAEQLNGTMATAPNVKGAWLNPNLDSPLLAIAFDAKDRKQYIYSREFVQKNSEAKFKIVEQMEKDLPVMRKQAAADRKAGTPEAFLFKLEDLTCIRVGSDKDTGAEKKAYGLTTLRGEHVKVEGDLIKLEFPAKGGESGSYAVKDKELAAFITGRKAANGDGPLWPDVTAGKFNAYLKELDPTTDTPVTAHKFRHYHATRIAAEVVAKYEGTELNPKAFTRVQKEACEKAAAHLSNTWTVTREKYVNPTVWGRLTVKAG